MNSGHRFRSAPPPESLACDSRSPVRYDPAPPGLLATGARSKDDRGAPAKAIQELAGHADLSTTLRYMHLSPEARDSAIRLVDTRPRETGRGDDGETGSPPSRNAVEH